MFGRCRQKAFRAAEQKMRQRFDFSHRRKTRRCPKDERITELICVTDAGRDGELIFRLVYHKAGCAKPFKRLWIGFLEDATIRKGFQHLSDSGEYDKLYETALSRSEADRIVGINGMRLFSTLCLTKPVMGRVQTPTLAMLVERERKIITFRMEKYFNVHVEKDGLTADMEKVKNEDEAKRIATACDRKQAVVSSVSRETETAKSPRLYDLTTLWREANRYYSFTAQQTLDLVQSPTKKSSRPNRAPTVSLLRKIWGRRLSGHPGYSEKHYIAQHSQP